MFCGNQRPGSSVPSHVWCDSHKSHRRLAGVLGLQMSPPAVPSLCSDAAAATHPCGKLALLKVGQLLLRSSFSAEEEEKRSPQEAGQCLWSCVGATKPRKAEAVAAAKPSWLLSLPWSSTGAVIHVWQPAQALASQDCCAGFISRFPQHCPPQASSPPLHMLPPDLPERWERLLGIYKELHPYFSSQAPRANTNVNLSVNRQALEGREGLKTPNND